jgi:hypothetical protein
MAWRSLPRSKCLECHVFGSPWCFTSVRNVSTFSAGSLVQELMRSAALSLLPSWILLPVCYLLSPLFILGCCWLLNFMYLILFWFSHIHLSTTWNLFLPKHCVCYFLPHMYVGFFWVSFAVLVEWSWIVLVCAYLGKYLSIVFKG